MFEFHPALWSYVQFANSHVTVNATRLERFLRGRIVTTIVRPKLRYSASTQLLIIQLPAWQGFVTLPTIFWKGNESLQTNTLSHILDVTGWRNAPKAKGTLISRRVCWNMRDNMVSRSAPWKYPCWVVAGRSSRRNALGDTFCRVLSHIDRWLADCMSHRHCHDVRRNDVRNT